LSAGDFIRYKGGVQVYLGGHATDNDRKAVVLLRDLTAAEPPNYRGTSYSGSIATPPPARAQSTSLEDPHSVLAAVRDQQFLEDVFKVDPQDVYLL
jgi:hypothetical protein